MSSACSSSFAKVASNIAAAGGVPVAQIPYDLGGVAAIEHAHWAEVRLSAELDDLLRNLARESLFLACMFQKLLRHALGVNFLRQVVMRLVAQHANDLRR